MFEEMECKIVTVFCIIHCILRDIFMSLWRGKKSHLTCGAESKIAAVSFILN